MNAEVKITTPDDFEVTITLRMPVKELREFRKLHEQNPNRSLYPLGTLSMALRDLSEQVDKTYFAEAVEFECPECGHDFTEQAACRTEGNGEKHRPGRGKG